MKKRAIIDTSLTNPQAKKFPGVVFLDKVAFIWYNSVNPKCLDNFLKLPKDKQTHKSSL